MMDSEATITGLADLQKQLDMLAPNIERKLLRGALRAGQKVVADYAKARAPVGEPSQEAQRKYGSKPGDLRDSIRVTTRLKGGTVTAKVQAGASKSKLTAFYAHMVEFGTKAHMISAKNGGALSFGGKEYAHLNHPGAKMRPFMRPALDMAANGNSEPMQAVAMYLQSKIDKELDKLPDEVDTK